MSYCSQTDVEHAAGGAARLAELGDFAADTGVDSAVLTALIAEAARWIDSYIAKRYSVPLETVPDTIKVECAREVVYRLRVSRETDGDRDREQHVERIEWLAGIAEGRITPGTDPLPTKSAIVAAESGDADDRSDTDVGTFTRDDYGGLW